MTAEQARARIEHDRVQLAEATRLGEPLRARLGAGAGLTNGSRILADRAQQRDQGVLYELLRAS